MNKQTQDESLPRKEESREAGPGGSGEGAKREDRMKLIDVEPALYDMQVIANLLPPDKREIMEHAIRIVQSQPEIPVEQVKLKGTV